MARLQILELPEGGGDERPPFVLVIDQYEPPPYPGEPEQSPLDGVAEKIGARAVLAFEDTIDIPANDTTAYLQQVAEETGATIGKITSTFNAQMLADERTEIARDMDRLAKRKQELADALGMDRLRDWDDIRNAAAALLRDRDEQNAELERLRAGEEPATNKALRPTPGQWIWQWNRATPEKRLDMAAQILDGMARANDCFMADHEAQIASLRAEVERLRTERSTAETPDA